MATTHTNAVRAKVIELYLAGKKNEEITRITRVPRATIYSILAQEGIRPNRLSPPGEGAADWRRLAEERQREIGRLEQVVADQDAAIRRLVKMVAHADSPKARKVAEAPVRPRRAS
jgi:hypothetical protein